MVTDPPSREPEALGRRKRTSRYPAEPAELRLAIYLFLTIVVFSPTINIISLTSTFLRPAALVTIAFCAVVFFYHYSMTRIGVAVAVVLVMLTALWEIVALFIGVALLSPVKAAGILVVVLVTPAIASNHREALHRFVVAAFAVTFIMIGLQLLGNKPWAYALVTYANEATPLDLIERSAYFGQRLTVAFLPQLRPSGTFPSPTYLGIFSIFLWTLWVTGPSDRRRLTLFALGIFFVLTGSTVGLFLTVATVVFVRKRPRAALVVLGALVALGVYRAALPYQFDYNFNLADVGTSVLSRLDLASRGESIVQQNPLALLAGASVLAVGLLFLRRVGIRLLVTIAISLALPVVIHDVSSSLLYWFIVALTLNGIFDLRLVARARRVRETVGHGNDGTPSLDAAAGDPSTA